MNGRRITIAKSVRELAACTRSDCLSPVGAPCNTATGRNHTERVRAALIEALRQEAEARGLLASKIGLPDE